MRTALYIKKKETINTNSRSSVFTWYTFLRLTKKKGERWLMMIDRRNYYVERGKAS